MSRFTGGWFRLDRRVFFEDIGADGYMGWVWVTLLSWANVEMSKTRLKGQQVTVERGQLVTSLRELSDKTGFARSTVSRCLRYLEKTGRIETQRGQPGTMITICKYDEYQRPIERVKTLQGRDADQPSDSPVTAQGQPRAAAATHNEQKTRGQEDKRTKDKGQSLSKGSRKRNPTVLTPHDIDLGQRWADHTNTEWPYMKADPTKYAEAVAKVKKSVGLDDKQMDYIFDFVSTDDFWKPNCQSPAGLLKKSKNNVRKVDNVLAKIKQEKYGHVPVLEFAKAYDEGRITREDLNRECAF